MAKLYLVTGFLGSGKTTFMREFVKLFPGKKKALIINEFGKAGVDGALLKDIDATLTEIDNGSIFCACRIDQFEDALTAILKRSPDIIFVEASGLADPTAVKGIFAPFRSLAYMGAICLIDAVRFHKIYQTAKVCRMQLAVSGLVLINKTDIATRQQIDEIKDIALAQRPNRPVFETSFGRIEADWLSAMEAAECDGGPAEIHTRDLQLQKKSLRVEGFDLASLTAFLKMFAEDTYRVKGFVEIDGNAYLADCVGPLVDVHPFTGETVNPGMLTVLYGHGLPAVRSIKEAAAWFPSCTIELL